MNPIVRLGLKIASLPIFDVTKNYQRIRRAQETLAPDAHEVAQDDFVLFDEYLACGDGESNVPVRIFVPKNQLQNGIIIFIHGGGYVTGNVDTYTEPCGRLATESGRIVCSIDYSLAPEHPFPQGLEDCICVTGELSDYFSVKNDPRLHPITIMGDSAGGNLATVTARILRETMDYSPDLQILLYPAVGNDYSENSPFPSVIEKGEDFGLTRRNMLEYYELYLDDPALLQDPRVSPLLAPDKSILPPALIVTCEHDLLRDEGEEYGRQLEQAGVPVEVHRIPDVPHGFFSNGPIFPDQNKHLVELIRDYLDRWVPDDSTAVAFDPSSNVFNSAKAASTALDSSAKAASTAFDSSATAAADAFDSSAKAAADAFDSSAKAAADALDPEDSPLLPDLSAAHAES